MTGILTHLRWLKDGCWDALSSLFTRWTKPLGIALPLAILTDLGRSKSELIAEDTLLRQQLIILRRQVKRPTFTRTDHILFVLLARLVRTWQQAHITRATRDVAPVASGALPPVLEAEVQDSYSPARGRHGNDRLDQRDGQEQSPSSVLKGFAGNC